MIWATAAVMIFLGVVMMLDERADHAHEHEGMVDDEGGAAQWAVGLVVVACGALVLIGAVRDALSGAG
jgi:hypothetical protein